MPAAPLNTEVLKMPQSKNRRVTASIAVAQSGTEWIAATCWELPNGGAYENLDPEHPSIAAATRELAILAAAAELRREVDGYQRFYRLTDDHLPCAMIRAWLDVLGHRIATPDLFSEVTP